MPHSSPLETYLRELRDGRAIGVAETSFYGPLANLLNAIGGQLKPRVRCIIPPTSAGAGIPDGGFYTPDQLPKTADASDRRPGARARRARGQRSRRRGRPHRR